MGILALFGFGRKKEIVVEYLTRQAQIIDVRMAGEFKTGHIKGALNIPLEIIEDKAAQVKELKKPIIVCCVSGMRSAVAAKKLRMAGIEAVNGGSWYGLRMIIDQEV